MEYTGDFWSSPCGLEDLSLAVATPNAVEIPFTPVMKLLKQPLEPIPVEIITPLEDWFSRNSHTQGIEFQTTYLTLAIAETVQRANAPTMAIPLGPFLSVLAYQTPNLHVMIVKMETQCL